MEIKTDHMRIIASSLEILNHLDIECVVAKCRIFWIKTELSELKYLDLSAFDEQEQTNAIRRIGSMLGEVAEYLQSQRYHFRALALSRVIDEIVKGEK